MESFINDIKYGLRNIKRRPTYAVIALLTLTIGIGVTTTMYTLVDKVLLQPLPLPKSEELVLFSFNNKKTNKLSSSSSISAYQEFVETDSPLHSLSFWAYDQNALAVGSEQKPLTTLITSANYMETFAVPAQIGRWYEEHDIGRNIVIISHRLWSQEFNSDQNITKRIIKLNKEDFQVIGVMPEGFSGTGYGNADLWMPINELDRNVQLVGRLKSGLTVQQAQQQTESLQRVVDRLNNDPERLWEVTFVSVLDDLVAETKDALFLLMASVIAVFLIAILNVVNLTFAQFSNRSQELAVRISLGATRNRLLRQLLTESLLLCMVGGLLGLLVAAWSLEWILIFIDSQLPRASEIGTDLNTILITLLLIIISTLLTALIPAYTLVNPTKLANAIKQAGRKSTGDKQSQKIRRILVSSEVGVAVVLLIIAGLFLRSYSLLINQETGFNSEGVISGHVWFSGDFNPQPNAATYWLELTERLSKLPGVTKVAGTSTMPMSTTGIDFPVQFSYPGAPDFQPGEEPRAAIRSITPGYFDTLEIPLIEGRDFDFRDTADSPKVVIINQNLANRNWPGQSAVGNILKLDSNRGGDHRVIGVVGNVKHRGLRSESINEFFLPVTQLAYPGMSFVVKTSSDVTESFKNLMLKTSVELEPTAPMILIRSLSQLTQSSIGGERVVLTILAVFAGIALVLASIGVYGISDNMVSQRINEIGIRMAIGASPAMIKKWVIWDTSRPVLIGIIVGLIMAFIISQYFASILYGVKSWDPITFTTIPLILFVVGILATWLPAVRATKIHPQKALQYE